MTITVHTGHPYPVHIGPGLLARAGGLAREICGCRKVCVVSDSNVAPLYLQTAVESFGAAGFEVCSFVFPAGETSKRLETVAAIYEKLAAESFTRGDLLAALGGGVTGDITGFAAATWMRGIDFIQLPTSLVAQVDSSVGGKTGVDIPVGKNLVGAFHQPRLVVADTDTLSTLTPEYFTDGMGEVIKHACIKDAALFETLADPAAMSPKNRADIVARNIDIKRRVVEADERESGERKLLNFGHTVGHSLESYYHYQGISHGCGVAVGMITVTRAAEKAGLTPPGTADKIGKVLRAYGLPESDPAPMKELLPLMLRDKKREGDTLDLVILKKIGEAAVHPLPLEKLEKFWL